MLCSVTCIVIPISLGIIHTAIFLLELVWVEGALPPGAEDEIVLIEHFPGRRVHLQDFFWTGAEDVPPWLDPEQTLTLYETKTIYHTATVYLPDDRQEGSGSHDQNSTTAISVCPQCIDPTPTLNDVDQDIGTLIGEDPGPRYWLLTVLQAGENVPPKVELRLARLYRTAFTRQQQRRLGLSVDSYSRKQRRRRSLNLKLISFQEKKKRNENLQDILVSNSSVEKTRIVPVQMRSVKIRKIKRTLRFQPGDFETQIRPFEESLESSTDSVKNESKNLDAGVSRLKSVDPNLVQVRMQNTSIMDGGSTKLIYSVHLGGKPVPAETAAREMALLSPQEVALELGAPVLIQSEPYLKETRPLALSRKRDAWLLIGAAGAAVMLLAIVIASLVVVAKRKRAHSAVVAPPTQSILKKDREYSSTTPGFDNTAYTSETEARTEITSQRHTPQSHSRTPITIGTPDSLEEIIKDISSDDEDDQKKRSSTPWDVRHYPEIPRNVRRKRINRTNAIEYPKSPDSVDFIGDQMQTLESLEKGFTRDEEANASPHSYLSMPSCKQFPNMKSVEPLCRVLEPTTGKQMNLEEYESPKMKVRKHSDEYFLTRASSATRDPGVIGPIVWDLRKKKSIEDSVASETDVDFQRIPFGPVGRARRRLHELLEDSFSLFGNRDVKQQQSTKHTPSSFSPEHLTIFSETRGKSAHVSPVATPASEIKTRPRTSLPRRELEKSIPETGNLGPHPRGAWGSRPMSAGPFHKPNFPEMNTSQIPANSQLPASDPAVPLITALTKELEKFSLE